MCRGLVALVAFTAVSAVALPSAASVPRRAGDVRHEGGIAPYGSAPALADAPASLVVSDRQLSPDTEVFSLFSGSELFLILQRASHRRLADDRFTYRWSWRGELVSVTVKDCWPVEAGQTADPACPGSQFKPPYSGQKIFFERDGLGRLLTKTHTGALPEGQTECDVYGSSCARPFIEKRRYLWDGETLVSEAAYAQDLPDGSEGPIRWRKSYVPGAAAVNGHPQVRVEIYDGAGANVVSEKLYSYLRDEQSTVTALVEERSGADLNKPPVTARYLYAPFGEAALDGGFETRRSFFDGNMSSTVVDGQMKTQTVNPAVAIPGALRTILSAAADPATLAGVVLERRNTDGTWGALQAADLAIGQPSGGPEELQVLPLAGWQKDSTYRLRLTPGLKDASGRTAADATIATLDIPASGVPVFDQSNPVRFETFLAAGSDLGGSFPGGQPFLFQGMYFDNITGLGITKNRVYDPRSASWLSEDPLDDVDSPNVYGFVAMRPQEKTDPMGLQGDFGEYEPSEFATEVAGEFMNLFSSPAELKASAQRSLRFLGGEVKGAVKAVPNLAKGVVHVATHPVQTVRGAVNLAKQVASDPEGAARKATDALLNADPDKAAEFVGETLALAGLGAAAKTTEGAAALSKLKNAVGLGKAAASVAEEGAASRVLPASRLGEVPAAAAGTDTVVLGPYTVKVPLPGGQLGVVDTLETLENAASRVGGRTLTNLPGNMSVLAPEIQNADRILFFTRPNLQAFPRTWAEMQLIQSSPSLLSKTTFIYGGLP